jgi:hypothetical protein
MLRVANLGRLSMLTQAFLFGVALPLSGQAVDSARVKELAEWLPAASAGLGRPVSNRAAWDKFAKNPAFSDVVANAATLANQPVPELPDELYLDYSRTGNRDRCQKVLFARGARLVTLTLAEGIEDRGRFVQPLMETIEAICSEKTWVYPAHDGRLDNFYGRTVEMDLRATAVAWELGTVDFLLGDKLSEPTRRLIAENVRRRVLQPFRDMVEGRRKEISWLHATHNWNAVCLAGTIGAALALEPSPQERAWFIAAGEQYIRYFLKGFTPDGYCSEGIGYWNYGFGHFLMLSETVRQATNGRLDLLAGPEALQPALFCKRSEILNGIFPTISDVHPGTRPDAQFVCYIARRFGLEATASCERAWVRPAGSLASTMLFSFMPAPLPPVPHQTLPGESPLRTWFTNGGVLLCRAAKNPGIPFAAALKGGNNAENHNHNDVGSFSVVAGKSMVICDPGSEVYTHRTFSAHRYDSKVLSSYGHAVPMVAGQLQSVGAEARAQVLRTTFSDDQDTLALDISSAYKTPELQRLERTFVFSRTGSASLTVRDQVAFASPQKFEEALITWSDWKQVSSNELILQDDQSGVRVRLDCAGEPLAISSEELNEDVPAHKKPIRLGIALKNPIKQATVTMTITPVILK